MVGNFTWIQDGWKFYLDSRWLEILPAFKKVGIFT
jgi:hypothetical protein